LIFTGSGLMGREVVNIRSSDIVVIVGGRSGTLGELAIAYDEGKLIGVLTGTGGISDLVADILDACKKDTGAQVVYDVAPRRLIRKLLHVYRTSHVRRPSCFCTDRPPGEEPAPLRAAERDPVCGMPLAASAAVAKRTLDAHVYLFCSPACVERFDADPLKYASRSKARV
jgi:YHS domain-containing protein